MTMGQQPPESVSHEYVLAGVGGQGVLLAARAFGEAAMAAGHEPHVAETHGMSQRGGSVLAHVRYGPGVIAPMVAKGRADAVIALEPMEALRYAGYLREGGTVVASFDERRTLAVERGEASYPSSAVLQRELEERGRLVRIDAESLAREAGTPKAANVVVLGAASAVLDLDIDLEGFREAIDEQVPEKARAANRRAFELGRKAAVDDGATAR